MAAWFKTRSWWHSSCGKDSFAPVRSQLPAPGRHRSACDCRALDSDCATCPRWSPTPSGMLQTLTGHLRMGARWLRFQGCLPESMSANILRTRWDLLITQLPGRRTPVRCREVPERTCSLAHLWHTLSGKQPKLSSTGLHILVLFLRFFCVVVFL